MARMQQRRIRFIAVGCVLALVFTYILVKRKAERATWPNPSLQYHAGDIPTKSWPDIPSPSSSSKLHNPESDGERVVLLPETTSDVHTPSASQGPALEKTVPLNPLPEFPTAVESDFTAPAQCMRYEQLQSSRQEPLSRGKRRFPYSRPNPECRTFNLPSMEKLIERMNHTINDPDLFRLFENSYPNTLDTMIKWRGFATETDLLTGNKTQTDEELTYIITGDIDAMWLRDSASQVYSYLPLLEASSDPDSLASLWRGLINIHSRYIIISPYCHSFQPPPESGVPPTHNGAYSQNHPHPPYDPTLVFDCKWELDSLASFLQISTAYYQKTNDLNFFEKYNWVSAVEAAVQAAGAMRLGTYSKDGKVEQSAWTFTGWTTRGSETLTNDGLGNPTKENGMVRTAFRPSDDACIYQLLVPANMMWAKYLEEASFIMEKLNGEKAANLTSEMRDFAIGVRKGIDRDAIVHHREFGDIFAYEIDGYGGQNLMDDANIPSLLSIPMFDYSQSSFPFAGQGGKSKNYDEIYSNTRKFAVSEANPYFMRGPVLSAIGGPHLGPGKGWPMAAIVRALTALLTSKNSDQKTKIEVRAEVEDQVRMVLDSTSGAGVVHESVNAWSEHDWSRAWFGWANGLFGELVLKLAENDEASGSSDTGYLSRSWQ